MTFTVDAPAPDPADPDATWSARFVLKNDPLCPLDILTVNDSATHANSSHVTVMNQCFFTGAPVGTHTETEYHATLNSFRIACEQYRMTALSVTGYFIGATMTDQGSIIAAQTSDSEQCVNMIDILDPEGGNPRVVCPMLYQITQSIPTYDAMTMGVNPYVSPAKEGFYMPYKMMDPEKWHSADDVCYMVRSGNAIAATQRPGFGFYTQAYPEGNYTGSTYEDAHFGPWLRPLDQGIGVTHVRSVARTSSFRITLRVCIEVMTRPDSSLASFTEPPALPDDHAVHMYYEIASRLNDAYPARDNSNGTLWQKIKNVAGTIWDTVSPALAAVPQLTPIVAAGNAVRKFMPGVESTLSALAEGKKQRVRLRRADGNQAKAAAQMKSQSASAAERANPSPRRVGKVLKNDARFMRAVADMDAIMARPSRKGGGSTRRRNRRQK